MLCFKKKDPKSTEYKIWYAMSNDGAGGCTFALYESKELAEWVEADEDEPFKEDTVGSINIFSTGDTHINNHVETIDGMIEDIEDELTEKWSNKEILHDRLDSLKLLKEKQNV
jgi:hypothetical protein